LRREIQRVVGVVSGDGCSSDPDVAGDVGNHPAHSSRGHRFHGAAVGDGLQGAALPRVVRGQWHREERAKLLLHRGG
jgi:hypothetical protein